ncbi:MAG: DUF3368 domain-containing protein [Thiofilum sp.]|uniref:DUF3368 domain-containing protein n=1 Tax=Thiofilum sp. TaxID=2212733 RepID=UPI0025D8932D|nr:DUF3368 domain-containing protein [Thiofilum sp.]MBK8452316.1 DUF3368 domain-containing protein [Thiofilum sp.]
MLIIADSSALIALAECDMLPLLDVLFQEVRVPRPVFEECTLLGKPQANRLATYLADKTIDIDLSSYIFSINGLGRGELHAMALYRYLNADRFLVDDQRAKKVAILNGISTIGSVGILLRAKERGLIPAIKPPIAAIQRSGIYLSERVVKHVLELAGEDYP